MAFRLGWGGNAVSSSSDLVRTPPPTALDEFLPEDASPDGKGQLHFAAATSNDDLARLDTLLVTLRRRVNSLDADLDQIEALSEQVGHECRRIARRPASAARREHSIGLISRAAVARWPRRSPKPRTVLVAAFLMAAGLLQAPVPAGPFRAIPAQIRLASFTPASTSATTDLTQALTAARAADPTDLAPAPPVSRAATSASGASARASSPLEFEGTLEVYSQPAGARVMVDRRNVGRTPMQLPGLRAGSHVVWVDAPGYERWSGGVLVPTDQVTQVQVTLRRENDR